MPNCIKSYKCDFCGHIKLFYSSPALPDIVNVVAANCKECGIGNMIVDFEDEVNHIDNYRMKYEF